MGKNIHKEFICSRRMRFHRIAWRQPAGKQQFAGSDGVLSPQLPGISGYDRKSDIQGDILGCGFLEVLHQSWRWDRHRLTRSRMSNRSISPGIASMPPLNGSERRITSKLQASVLPRRPVENSAGSISVAGWIPWATWTLRTVRERGLARRAEGGRLGAP